ncbi:MAG: hypothetical protein INR62_11020, partial [Rhodospirillales bacterium]|nr:hypothetical protein [Acetobacter sp.]
LYLRAQQPTLAIQEAELALAEDPDDTSALYQEILARRRSGDTAAVPALTARLEKARRANQQQQEKTDRYRLETTPAP